MSQSGSRTSTLGQKQQFNDPHDDDEQLSPNNDTAASSNGSASNILSSSNYSHLRWYSEFGNEQHVPKRQCLKISAENASTKTEFRPIISNDTMNNSTNNRIVSPDTTGEMTTGYCVGIEDKVEVGAIDMVWSRVVIEQLLCKNELVYPLTIYDAQRSPIIRSQYYVPDHYQLMIDGWNYACEQERFRNDPSKRTNIVIGRNSRRTITNVVIGREWRRTIYMQAYEFISTLQIPTSMTSAAFAMLDRFNDRELLVMDDLTIAFWGCFSFAVETHMSRSIIPMISSDVFSGSYSITQLIHMEKRIKQFFLSTEIGIEYGCSPLHANEYSQPIIAERHLYILESHFGHLDISNLLGVDCSLLLDQAKHVAATCALEEDYICIRPSSIAFASVLVAMDILHFPYSAYTRFYAIPVYRYKEETKKIFKRMRGIYHDLIHQQYSPFEAII